MGSVALRVGERERRVERVTTWRTEGPGGTPQARAVEEVCPKEGGEDTEADTAEGEETEEGEDTREDMLKLTC